MTFIAISQVKGLNDLRLKPPLSCARYDDMGRIIGVAIRIVEGDTLGLITMKYIYYLLYASYYFLFFHLLHH
jgi:hypothetical protein